MLSRRFAMLLGLFLLVEGIWGLFSPVVFGVLSTNWLHAAIEIVLGIGGLLAGRGAHARVYLKSVGTLLLVVGILFFVPGLSEFVISLLNVNIYVACFNIIVGLLSIIIGLTGSSPEVVVVEPPR